MAFFISMKKNNNNNTEPRMTLITTGFGVGYTFKIDMLLFSEKSHNFQEETNQ